VEKGNLDVTNNPPSGRGGASHTTRAGEKLLTRVREKASPDDGERMPSTSLQEHVKRGLTGKKKIENSGGKNGGIILLIDNERLAVYEELTKRGLTRGDSTFSLGEGYGMTLLEKSYVPGG